VTIIILTNWHKYLLKIVHDIMIAITLIQRLSQHSHRFYLEHLVYWDIKGTVARDFDADFFIPIDRLDLGDGPLRGINYGRCSCAEKRAFYALTRMLILGTNAHLWYENKLGKKNPQKF